MHNKCTYATLQITFLGFLFFPGNIHNTNNCPNYCYNEAHKPPMEAFLSFEIKFS